MTTTDVVVAGATGKLGLRIVRALVARGASVRALVRAPRAPSSDSAGSSEVAAEKVATLEGLGATVVNVDFNDVMTMANASRGAACMVSALAGLRSVIMDTQSLLLDAALEAGIPRFIPSDFSMDFTQLSAGSNRNLDLRREFHSRLDQAPIRATSVFNGAFTDMLTGQAPLVLFKFKRVLFWGDADQKMDFTTMEDSARYTAAAGLDPSAPRFLRIAGDEVSARELTEIVSDVTRSEFKLMRAGSLQALSRLGKVVRAVMPTSEDLYPPWQGMQYLHDMFSGRAKAHSLDNARYPMGKWTTVREVLAAAAAQAPGAAPAAQPPQRTA